MRSVLFTRDDNFFLQLQSRDVINHDVDIDSESSGMATANLDSSQS